MANFQTDRLGWSWKEKATLLSLDVYCFISWKISLIGRGMQENSKTTRFDFRVPPPTPPPPAGLRIKQMFR